jgi:uncharacterized protein YpmB
MGPEAASTPGSTSQQVNGGRDCTDRDTAVAVAQSKTPLRSVTSAQGTQTLPCKQIVIGKDEAGKEVVVGVRGDWVQCAYTDALLSQEQAVRIAERNLVTPAPFVNVTFDFMDGKNAAVIWYVTTREEFFRIDATTGRILAHRQHGTSSGDLPNKDH